jgi:hypothetical protein
MLAGNAVMVSPHWDARLATLKEEGTVSDSFTQLELCSAL